MALTKVIGAGVQGISNSSDATAMTIGSDEVVDFASNADFIDGRGIRLGAGNDFQLYHDGTDNHINVTGAQTLNIQTSGNNAIVVDANGHVTKPLQPAFLVKPSTQQDNINGDGSDVDVAFGSEIFDNNADFASSTFTAPVTGRYFFTVSLRFENADTASAYVQIYLKTSNRIIKSIQSTNVFSADVPYLHVHMTSLSDMDANDTCKIQLQLEGSGASQADVDPESFFQGI